LTAAIAKTLRPTVAVAATLLVALALDACGGSSERSPEAYCRAFYETAAPIRESYVEAGEEVETDPLGAIVTLLGSPGDLTVIFDSMSKHAPDEIQADTEAARDALEEEQESLGEEFSDPLGAIGAGVIAGLTSPGSFSRVDAYLNEHCPVDSELAQEVISDSK
jgi:hypothetical protein